MSDIIESVMPFDYILEEGSDGGKMKIKGIYQKSDTQNENGRIYPRRILERETNQLQEMIKERRLLGELNHPQSAEINLERACHLVTMLEMKSDGVVYGESDVLLGTPYGAILESLLRNGVKLGISSRGKGTTVYRNGVNEVNEDYKMITFDMVSRPSTPGAYPKAIVESSSELGKVVGVSMGTLVNNILNNNFTIKEASEILKRDPNDPKKFFSFKDYKVNGTDKK